MLRVSIVRRTIPTPSQHWKAPSIPVMMADFRSYLVQRFGTKQRRAKELLFNPKSGQRRSASVILIAPTDEVNWGVEHHARFKLLFVKRSKQMKFMPNLYAFPGGKVDMADFTQCEEDPNIHSAQRYHHGGNMPWVPERVTALRELAEECGVVLDHNGAVRSIKYLQPSYHAIGKLIPFQNWVTPVQETRRFDTAFFLLPTTKSAPDELLLTLNPDEIADARWLCPEEAIYLHNTSADFRLPPPTQLMVHQMAQFTGSNTLLSWHESRFRNDLLEMKPAAPFVDISDGNFNMHFARETFASFDMPPGKHVFSLGYALPKPFVDFHREHRQGSRMPPSRADVAAADEMSKDAASASSSSSSSASAQAADPSSGNAEQQQPMPNAAPADEVSSSTPTMATDNADEIGKQRAAQMDEVKLVVHVGSPLLDTVSDLYVKEHYDKIIEHRSDRAWEKFQTQTKFTRTLY